MVVKDESAFTVTFTVTLQIICLRKEERKETSLFDIKAYNEAIVNAVLHNKWLTLNGPQISIFTDRIEILSHGGLALGQDIEGFYNGASIPVNEILASIFYN